jgi:hypothetical protein
VSHTALEKYELVVDGATTTASGSPQYSLTANVQNFAKCLIFVKEDNTNAIKFTVEARAADHAKAAWTEIKSVVTVAKDGTEVITVADAADLDSPWFEIRLKYYDSVDGVHGKIYAWINRKPN